MRGHFGWEYKGKHKDLKAAYDQLLDYREDLENPPLFVVSDMHRFEVHTNFPATRKRVYKFTLDELQANLPTPDCVIEPFEVLKALFFEPARLHPSQSRQFVTEDAAEEFNKLSANFRVRNIDPEKAAHFMMRLLFCLFADDIGLLPERMFHQMLETSRGRPENFKKRLKPLFAAMQTGGDYGSTTFPGLTAASLRRRNHRTLLRRPADLHASATLNWSFVEPAIFGTLFERNFDPTKHNLVGAHYTSKADILLIIEPVLIEPLRERWQTVKTDAEALIKAATGPAYAKNREKARDLIAAWLDELSAVRVLDPACGSGNFFYLALKRLLDVWKEAYVFCAEHGLPFLGTAPRRSNPALRDREKPLRPRTRLSGRLDRLPPVADGKWHGRGQAAHPRPPYQYPAPRRDPRPRRERETIRAGVAGR